jgi:hypothetical protein
MFDPGLSMKNNVGQGLGALVERVIWGLKLEAVSCSGMDERR